MTSRPDSDTANHHAVALPAQGGSSFPERSGSMRRRRFLQTLAGACVAMSFPHLTLGATTVTKLVKSKAEWKALLPEDRYRVLFEEDTERAHTSPLNHEKRKGTFICAACNFPLFNAKMKYDSGTGWPSFWDVLPGAVGTRTDYKLIWPRTEYHCARCGGHQGHVFNDGPAPTGLRYCNNGLALRFVPDPEQLPPLQT